MGRPDDDGTPLPGVSIIIKGTTAGSSTDADGDFRISVPDRSWSLVTWVLLPKKLPSENMSIAHLSGRIRRKYRDQ